MRNLVLVILTFLIVSCGNTVKDQAAAWESNKIYIEQYVAKYPSLADKINAQYLKAQESMEQANKLGDEKKRIHAMKYANSLCQHGVIETINRLESAIESLKTQTKTLKENIKTDEFSPKTAFLLQEATGYLEKADMLLEAKYNSSDSALIVFENESKRLEDIEHGLETHYREILDNRPKETDKNVSVNSSTDSSLQNSSSTTKIATLKCKKCGGLLKEGDVKCKNCGAPVKK